MTKLLKMRKRCRRRFRCRNHPRRLSTRDERVGGLVAVTMSATASSWLHAFRNGGRWRRIRLSAPTGVWTHSDDVFLELELPRRPPGRLASDNPKLSHQFGRGGCGCRRCWRKRDGKHFWRLNDPSALFEFVGRVEASEAVTLSATSTLSAHAFGTGRQLHRI